MERKRQREIKWRIVLKDQRRNISAADFAALIHSLCLSHFDRDIGFNHATTDINGWLSSLAPYGVTINDAFVEDMLYAANMLQEQEKFQHPQGKTLDEVLNGMLKKTEYFDKDTNTIREKKDE
jgi:hypothetical protein